jgi:peptidoglycan/xylan/chitin deacetylase (PgdA/CDA1 family)
MAVASRVAKKAQHVAEGCLYAALWPAVRSSRRRLYPPPHPNEIALTFDDGPNPECTPRLLDVLGACQIKAAFFFVGKFVEAHPALVRRVMSEGHAIGNHTWSHPNLTRIPLAEARQELSATSQLLEQITGAAVGIFRPPYGACNAEVLIQARGLGMLPVFWNAMTVDWEDHPASQVVDELVQQIDRNRGRRRATYLVLHDGSADRPHANCSQSIEAAVQLIRRLRGEYRFVSIQTW